MASLKEIRRRISSVRNTQKITRAMKLVAAAKLRRAQDNVVRVRPYANRLRDVVTELAQGGEAEHPLLVQREPRRVLVVMFTSDRGLCGGFNTNVMRRVQEIRRQRANLEGLHLAVIGRKGQEQLRFHRVAVGQQYPGLDVASIPERAAMLANKLINDYLEGVSESGEPTEPELDQVLLVYNEFKSAMTQGVVVEQLLPIVKVGAAAEEGSVAQDFLFEPNKAAVLDRVLRMYVEVELYRAAAESVASEYGARMTAMDNATKNAQEMIGNLTLEYNKTRQAAITKELLEIVAGAEALKQ